MATIDAIRDLKNIDKDDILGALGLQAKRTQVEAVLPVIGIFAAGLAAGIGVGMLLAPKSGRQLRRELGRQIDSARDRVVEVTEEIARH